MTCTLYHLYSAPLNISLRPPQSRQSFYFVPAPLFPQQGDDRGKATVRILPKCSTASRRLVFLPVREKGRANMGLVGGGVRTCFQMYRGGGGTRCLLKKKKKTEKNPDRWKPQNTTAAAPQQSNQPIRTEETLMNTHFNCFHQPVHFSVFVPSSGCLNLFVSHDLATSGKTRENHGNR